MSMYNIDGGGGGGGNVFSTALWVDVLVTSTFSTVSKSIVHLWLHKPQMPKLRSCKIDLFLPAKKILEVCVKPRVFCTQTRTSQVRITAHRIDMACTPSDRVPFFFFLIIIFKGSHWLSRRRIDSWRQWPQTLQRRLHLSPSNQEGILAIQDGWVIRRRPFSLIQSSQRISLL